MTIRRRAMSLIEVTIVILIMGLLAAVATPRFASTLQAMQLESATQQLAAHLRYVRQVAINEGRTTSVSFDNSNATYSSDSVDFPHLVGTLLHIDLAKDYGQAVSMVADIDSSMTVSFDFEGVPYVENEPMLNGEIVLSAGDNAFSVMIAAGTGRISLSRLAEVDGQLVQVVAAAGGQVADLK